MLIERATTLDKYSTYDFLNSDYDQGYSHYVYDCNHGHSWMNEYKYRQDDCYNAKTNKHASLFYITLSNTQEATGMGIVA